MKLKIFEEQLFFTTIRITRTDKTTKGASIGTGFIIRAPITDEVAKDRTLILLVSNKHILGGVDKKTSLSFHQGAGNDMPDLGKTSVFEEDDISGVYTEHPDPNVDLACINISAITATKFNIFSKMIFREMIMPQNMDGLFPGASIWFIGYPENRFDTLHNLPLLRRGYVASLPDVDFNGRKEFIIDAQVFPGSSGSPVFATIGQEYKLVGVVSQTMIKNERLQAVPSNVGVVVNQTIGLGIVIKGYLVNELIDITMKRVLETLKKNKGSEPTSTNEEAAKH